MNGYIAFSKKEWLEAWRSYRLPLMLAVFLIFGMMNPLTAKLMPVLVDNFMPAGIVVNLPEPTALDSWAQFYKNVPQLGLLFTAVLFSGMLSGEYARGTLVIPLSHGLSRRAILWAKLSVSAALWAASFVLCFTVSWAYTAYFWDGDQLQHLLFAAGCLWLFGLLLIVCLLLGGCLFRSTYGCLLFTGGFVGLQFLMGIFPQVNKYLPLRLASENLALIQEETPLSDLLAPLGVTAILLVGGIGCAHFLFARKNIA